MVADTKEKIWKSPSYKLFWSKQSGTYKQIAFGAPNVQQNHGRREKTYPFKIAGLQRESHMLVNKNTRGKLL